MAEESSPLSLHRATAVQLLYRPRRALVISSIVMYREEYCAGIELGAQLRCLAPVMHPGSWYCRCRLSRCDDDASVWRAALQEARRSADIC